jgi:hypothetical protein
MCNHSGYHTPTSRYDGYRRELRFILVCDECGAGLGEFTKVPYEPQFAPIDHERTGEVSGPPRR